MDVKTVPSAFNKNSIIESIKHGSDEFEKKIADLKLPPFLKKTKVLVPVLSIIVLTIILLLTSFSSSDTTVPTYTVKKDKFLVTLTESGEVRAKNSISIASPRIRGNLKIVYLIPEGTYVKSGDVVVRFDPSDAMNSLKEAESNLEISLSEREKLLANHRSAIAQTENELRNAELNFELSKLNLEQIKFEAEIKQQQARLQYKKDELSYERAKKDAESKEIIRKAELNKMDIEVQQKRSELDKVKKDIEMLTLTAPKSGLAVYEINWANNGRKFNVGDQITWGGMPIVSLPDLSQMESLTYVNEVDVSKIQKGQKVKVKLDAFQDSIFDAEITDVARLGKSKDNNSNIKVFEIAVGIYGQSEILKPGMTTSNQIIINEIPNVVFVPQESVFEKEGKKIVYIRNGSGFDEKEVEVGEKSENYIIITKGINSGEEVALRDPTIKIDESATQEETGSPVQQTVPVKQ